MEWAVTGGAYLLAAVAREAPLVRLSLAQSLPFSHMSTIAKNSEGDLAVVRLLVEREAVQVLVLARTIWRAKIVGLVSKETVHFSNERLVCCQHELDEDAGCDPTRT